MTTKPLTRTGENIVPWTLDLDRPAKARRAFADFLSSEETTIPRFAFRVYDDSAQIELGNAQALLALPAETPAYTWALIDDQMVVIYGKSSLSKSSLVDTPRKALLAEVAKWSVEEADLDWECAEHAHEVGWDETD